MGRDGSSHLVEDPHGRAIFCIQNHRNGDVHNKSKGYFVQVGGWHHCRSSEHSSFHFWPVHPKQQTSFGPWSSELGLHCASKYCLSSQQRFLYAANTSCPLWPLLPCGAILPPGSISHDETGSPFQYNFFSRTVFLQELPCRGVTFLFFLGVAWASSFAWPPGAAADSRELC